MNILLINWQDIKNPFGGGAEVHLHEVFKRIVQKGHSVTLLCCKYKGAPAEEMIDGIKVIRRGSRNLFNFYVPYWYKKLVRFEKFDVVVDDINKIPFYTPLYVKEPLVGVIHHLFGKSIFLEAPLPAAIYVSTTEKLGLYVYRKLVLVVGSLSTYRELIEKGFSEAQLPLVQYSVDHALYRQKQSISSKTNHIGYLGRIKKYKSVDHLIHAFKIVLDEMPQVKLSIVGDGDGKESLERLAQELELSDSITFHGFVSEEMKVDLLNQMHVVVNTSAKEGWGLTVVEANACGVPVIASDVPGLRDSVVDEKTGLLYEYGNIEQLVQKILLVLRDSHLRNKLAEEALVWAKSFDWDSSAEKMLEVLTQVIEEKKKVLE